MAIKKKPVKSVVKKPVLKKKSASKKKKPVDELKGDPEFLEFLLKLESDKNLTWLCRMRKIISWKKKNRGLINVSGITYNAKTTGPEEVARGFFMMEKAIAEGRCKEESEPVF